MGLKENGVEEKHYFTTKLSQDVMSGGIVFYPSR